MIIILSAESYLSLCQFELFFLLVLFIAVPEPLYTGPDSVQLFSSASLQVLVITAIILVLYGMTPLFHPMNFGTLDRMFINMCSGQHSVLLKMPQFLSCIIIHNLMELSINI